MYRVMVADPTIVKILIKYNNDHDYSLCNKAIAISKYIILKKIYYEIHHFIFYPICMGKAPRLHRIARAR